jgi:hypothetical protein
MRPRRDTVDLSGHLGPRVQPADDGRRGTRRRFLSVWYRCCHAYGRLYRNRQETHYEGRCPACGARVSVGIGPDGTTRRTFEAA